MSMNISFIIGIDPYAIKLSGGPAFLNPQDAATIGAMEGGLGGHTQTHTHKSPKK